ncbi:hypothetical protein HYV57_02510 [Candidatus Peregrinibacteria bacterium]|nr:hypothetical protein [Candidatus Peregrinibacteria bacterium]
MFWNKQCKNCINCGERVVITPDDQDFYQLMDVPEPTHCYLCRMQRRLSYRNESFLYHRKCDLTGKQIISAFSVNKPFPVYDLDAWWSENSDSLCYGRNFDFEKPFFDQFFALRDQVPRLCLQQQRPMTNSSYCHGASRNKNCYLTFCANMCEDCYYGNWLNRCRDCVDNTNINECELMYECVGCRECYNLRFCWDCNHCSDSYFLRNCQGCKNCFACTNQAEKQYMVMNEQLTKEQYERFLKDAKLTKYSKLSQYKEKMEDFLQKTYVKYFSGTKLENSMGNYLKNCKNAYMSFECDNCEDVRYGLCLNHVKTSADYSYWGENAERIHECQGCGYDLFNLRFCNLCWSGCSNLTYCDHCFACKECFGCVGLKKQEYCILNKKYSKEEYFDLKNKIIAHMKRTGEWGEFFPVNRSVHAYNETPAYEQMPLSKEEVLKKGWQWQDEEEKKNKYMGPKVEIPDDIHDVDASISEKIFLCESSEKPYKIIPQELKFYQRMGIPIPRKSPNERHNDRFKKRNRRRFYDQKCQNCGINIMTTYEPKRQEIIYCEKCYLEKVYG